MQYQQSSIRSIRFQKVPTEERASSRSRLSLNAMSLHSHSSLAKLAAVRSLWDSYQQSATTAAEFIELYVALPPLVKHTRLQELNSFSKQFPGMESVFRNSRLKPLVHRLQLQANQNSYDAASLCELIGCVLTCCTSGDIFHWFQIFKASCRGFTSKAMALHFGTHLYMVSSRYAQAHDLLDELLRLVLKEELNQYLALYLRLKIIALCNQNDKPRALGYLKKLVKVSWLYRLTELEMWCYHQMSKLYLSLHEQQLARIMNSKAEEGISEGPSKYRTIMCEIIQQEVREMKKSHNDFDISKQDLDVLLMRRRHQSQSECQPNLKEVRLLASKLTGSDSGKFQRLFPRLFRERRKTKDEEEIQMSLMLTHMSKLKNFNCFFREDAPLLNSNDGLITIENPSINWPILREMLRRIAQQGKPDDHA